MEGSFYFGILASVLETHSTKHICISIYMYIYMFTRVGIGTSIGICVEV